MAWSKVKRNIAGVALAAGVLCLAAKGPYRDLGHNYGMILSVDLPTGMGSMCLRIATLAG